MRSLDLFRNFLFIATLSCRRLLKLLIHAFTSDLLTELDCKASSIDFCQYITSKIQLSFVSSKSSQALFLRPQSPEARHVGEIRGVNLRRNNC